MSGWIHHVDLSAVDPAAATRFYDQVLPLIGFRRVNDVPEGAVWRGARAEIGVQTARAGAPPHDRYAPGLHHLAFGAPSRTAVDELHAKLLDLGIEILDPPAQYDQYEPGYYAVFFAGPDGVKLEYVYTPGPS